MRLAIALGAAGLCVCAAGAPAQTARPSPILPESLNWFSPPHLNGVAGAWILGSEKAADAYALRVKLARGSRIPPHTHPDTRYSTVLSGTLFVGFGETARDAEMVAVPAGAVYVAPAGVPHHLWARDGEVVYQEGGVGPTATLPVRR